MGVGTAWISAGLGERTDVEVISVEVDRRLTDATLEWPWPAHVHIVTADALEVLGTLGTFQLVFADASPIKYGHIESVISVLRPGGVLVVDDLQTDQPRKNALRRSLLHSPELQGVELEWSSGVILATRTYGTG